VLNFTTLDLTGELIIILKPYRKDLKTALGVSIPFLAAQTESISFSSNSQGAQA
jgi:hypothetical protein